MNRYRAFAALLCAAALASCGETAVQDITGPLPAARVRFFNFGVGSPGVNFYANETKMTAILTGTGTESTVGVNYGGVGSAGYYTGIEPGQYTLSGRIAAATDKDLPISNVTATIEAGKAYSFFQSGVYSTATKTVDGFIVEDPIPAEFDWQAANVRFVNAIHNSVPLTLHASHTEVALAGPVGGAVAYKAANGFTRMPNGVYNLYAVNAAGDTVITRNAVSFSAGTVYTITAIGDMTITATSGRPTLDNTINR